MDSLYNTGCVPLNVFMVWGSLAVITAVVSLLRIRFAKTRFMLQTDLTSKDAAVAVLVSVVAVLILYYVFKALCTSDTGRIIGYVAVGLLLLGTALVTGEVYVNYLAKYEVRAANYVTDKAIMLGNKVKSFRRSNAPAAAAAMVSPTSSEPALPPRGYNYF
jgi:uncharacterized membrane protein YjfL (UPF0719 family)